MFSFTKKAAQDIALPELTEEQLTQVAGGACSSSSDYNNTKYTHKTHHWNKHHQWHKNTKNTRGSHGSGWKKSTYGSDKKW